MGQAVYKDGSNPDSLHLERWVGRVVGKVQQRRQPAPVAPDQAVQGIKACRDAALM